MRTRLIKWEKTGAGNAALHLALSEDLTGYTALHHYGPVDGDWIVLNPDGTYEEYIVQTPQPKAKITRKTQA